MHFENCFDFQNERGSKSHCDTRKSFKNCKIADWPLSVTQFCKTCFYHMSLIWIKENEWCLDLSSEFRCLIIVVMFEHLHGNQIQIWDFHQLPSPINEIVCVKVTCLWILIGFLTTLKYNPIIEWIWLIYWCCVAARTVNVIFSFLRAKTI